MTKSGRIRTESMIDRLGRKPLSEGFDLWDKDYMLGALRLFQCKLEVAPPFEVVVCLDAVGDILTGIEEPEEALEHYNQAIGKYKMINKAVLSELMQFKAFELQEDKGSDGALEAVDKYLATFDERLAKGQAGEELLGTEAKGQGSALGRVYLYRAELLKAAGKPKEALSAVDVAVQLKCDRIHLAYGTQGDLFMDLDMPAEALEAYGKAADAKPTFVAAHESTIRVLKEQEELQAALKVLETAMQLHPKAVLIRDKAFILSSQGNDDEALQVLDAAIKAPPHEETETLSGTEGPSVCTLRKAKAAILADMEKFEEANEELSKVLKYDPEEEEAALMRKDIFITIARGYLGKHDIPQYLDSLVAKVLEAKPDAPVAFMIECIEKELEQQK